MRPAAFAELIENEGSDHQTDARKPFRLRAEAALGFLIELPAALLIVAETAILFVGVIFRYLLNQPLVWSDELASILFVWLAMLGAASALRRGVHMRMTALLRPSPPWLARKLDAFALTMPILFLGLLIGPSIDYANDQWIAETPALGLPETVRAAAIPAGCVLMLAMAVLQLLRHKWLDVAIPAMFAGAIAVALHFTAQPIIALGNWNLFLFFALMLGIGVLSSVPIAFCFGLSTVAYLLTTSYTPLEIVAGRIHEGTSSIILLAIPLFILLGHFMVTTSMAKVMVEFLAALIGHVRGGLSYVLLASIVLVSGISGAKTADMAAVAPILFPEMKRRGIHEGELVSLLAASGAMAETIPPSIVLIIIGSVAGVSIADMFTGGLLPGVFLALGLAFVARRRMIETVDVVRNRAPVKTVLRKLIIALPALTLPVVVMLSVVKGIATATEVSTIGLVYTVLVGVLVYRRFEVRRLYSMLVETAALSGAILFIIGCATAMAWALTQSNFSHTLALTMSSLSGGGTGFLLISIAVFVVLGSILEGIPAMVLFGPLLFPVARQFGVHEVHYAIVIILAMGIGLFAPPFGLGYYAACTIGRVHPDAGLSRIWPYLAVLVAGVVIIAMVPWLATGFLTKTR